MLGAALTLVAVLSFNDGEVGALVIPFTTAPACTKAVDVLKQRVNHKHADKLPGRITRNKTGVRIVHIVSCITPGVVPDVAVPDIDKGDWL